MLVLLTFDYRHWHAPTRYGESYRDVVAYSKLVVEPACTGDFDARL
jgi:hypothetical protein